MANLTNLLTDSQIRALHDLIQNHYNAVVYNTIKTKGFLTEAEVDSLIKKGLIDSSLRNPLLDAYMFGKIQHVIGQKAARVMTYNRFVKYLSMNPVALTAIETAAISNVNKVASYYIANKLADKAKAEVAQLIRDADRKMIAGALRDQLPTNIQRRESLNALASKLGRQVQSHSEDFLRIAHTEKHNAMQAGVASAMYDVDPAIKVVKIPSHDACAYCIKLFVKPDGNLRIFRLKDIMTNSNVGRKKRDWLPTVDAVHPWCGCELTRIPKGFFWNPKTRFVEPLVKSMAILQKDGTYNWAHSIGGMKTEKRLKPLDDMMKGLSTMANMTGVHCDH